MTIRTKLTLWYAAVLFASLTLCGGLLYNEWVLEPQKHHRSEGREDPREGMSDLLQNLLFSALPAAVLGLGGGWLLTRKALSPVAALTETARRVSESNLGVRLPRSGNGDELDRLTEVFNAMILRLDNSFQRIREFTLRASHELKTPLTIMRAGLESSLVVEGLSGEMNERILDQLDEIDRLTKIVDGLTLLTKADASLVKVASEPVALDRLVEESYQDGRILALPNGVSMTLLACEAMVVTGDANRLRQLLLNLVDNAIKYNREGGSVTLELRREDGRASLSISNTGETLSPELCEQAFEPFFRGDASHSRAIDGCGLGLSIARWIVTSHGGAITLSSPAEGVTRLLVSLPLLKGSPGKTVA